MVTLDALSHAQGGTQQTLLELRYRVSESEHRRCLHQLTWMEVPLLPFRQARTFVSLLVVGAFGISPLVYYLLPMLVRFRVLPDSLVANEVTKQITAFYVSFPLTAILLLVVLGIIAFWLVEKVLRNGAGKWVEDIVLSVFPEGLREVSSLQKPSEQSWDDLVFLRQHQGDIYLIARSRQRSLYIPRSAFVSLEDAATFYRALVLLKKAKGNPSALPHATSPPP